MRSKRKLCCSSTTSTNLINPIMFFKVYLPDRSSKQLKLPSAFVKKLNYAIPPKSILVCFRKRSWSVDVEEVDNTLVFQNGWSDFVNDSSLEPGDFLVFSYLGAAKINVQIYGQSGVEKNDMYASKQCKIETDAIVPHDQYNLTNQHGEEMNNLVEYEQLQNLYRPINQIGGGKNTLLDDERLNDQTNENANGAKKLADEEHLHDYGQEMDKSEDEEQSNSEDSDYHYESEGVSDENRKQKSRKKKSTMDKDNCTEDKDKSAEGKKRPRNRGTPKHRIWNGDGIKNRVPDVSFVSEFPHFKMGIIPNYTVRASLNVPMPFARKYMKPGRIRTTLQTSDNSWPVTLTTYEKNGCCKISSGWLAFVRDNCIKVGDICVFELINPNSFTIRVSIFSMHP